MATRSGLRGGARRLRLGLSTILGLAPRGFFIPYRYAAEARALPYPALEPFFEEAGPAFDDLLSEIERYGRDIRAILHGPGPARFDQDWFPRLDAAAAYAIVRRERPARIVEIGSGHSTRFLARAVSDAGLPTEMVAIDPAPRASLGRLGIRHEARLLGSLDLELIAALSPSDILFVDSSHVAMPGTDLDRIVGDVLPRLAPGTLLHFHDILLPDAYPGSWGWRGYNEQIVVAALLGGGGYDIVFSSRWIASRRPERLSRGVLGELPIASDALETSLWLRKRSRARDTAAP